VRLRAERRKKLRFSRFAKSKEGEAAEVEEEDDPLLDEEESEGGESAKTDSTVDSEEAGKTEDGESEDKSIQVS